VRLLFIHEKLCKGMLEVIYKQSMLTFVNRIKGN
jgi:hypothetical protein